MDLVLESEVCLSLDGVVTGTVMQRQGAGHCRSRAVELENNIEFSQAKNVRTIFSYPFASINFHTLWEGQFSSDVGSFVEKIYHK